MNATFTPATGFSNPHVQTLWPFLFRKSPVLSRHRERFHTPDNDFFDVDWYGSGSKGIVILIHGLTGCSSSHYRLCLQDVLARNGYTTAALNCRACSGEPNLKAGSYHAGFTNDLDQLYRAISTRYEHSPVYTVGFSLGGNLMLKWLSEQADKIDVSASVAVSVPYKLDNCADKIDSGFSRIYRSHLINAMTKKLANKLAFFKSNKMNDEANKLKALGDLGWIKSFWEFDDHVVAKLHGFKGVHDYYQKNSSISFLKRIETSTLLIHALDDPFMTPSVLPKAHKLSPSTELLTSPDGGHVGFISPTTYWLEEKILDYFSSFECP
jgi:hypothetical protein